MKGGNGLGPWVSCSAHTEPRGERETPRDLWGNGMARRGNGCKGPVSQNYYKRFTAMKWQSLELLA